MYTSVFVGCSVQPIVSDLSVFSTKDLHVRCTSLRRPHLFLQQQQQRMCCCCHWGQICCCWNLSSYAVCSIRTRDLSEREDWPRKGKKLFFVAKILLFRTFISTQGIPRKKGNWVYVLVYSALFFISYKKYIYSHSCVQQVYCDPDCARKFCRQRKPKDFSLFSSVKLAPFKLAAGTISDKFATITGRPGGELADRERNHI